MAAEQVTAPTLVGVLERLELALLGSVLAVVVVRVWLMWLPAPLSLDETGAVWAASSAHPFQAATRFPQSLPFIAVLAATRRVLGTSGEAMRLPSLVAALAALGLLVSAVWRRLGPRTALWAGCLWSLNPEVVSTGRLARPYAFAQLAAVGTTVLLVRLLEKPTPRRALELTVGGTFLPWGHYLYGLMLPGAWVSALVRLRRVGAGRTFRLLLVAPIAWVLMSLPLLPPLLAAFGQRQLHELPADGGFVGLVGVAFPIPLVAGIAALALAGSGKGVSGAGLPAGSGRVLLVAAVSAPVTASLAELGLGTRLGQARYLAAGVAAAAIVSARWVVSRRPAILRVAVLTGLALFSLRGRMGLGSFWPSGGGYERGVEEARRETHSGAEATYALSDFVEGWRVGFPLEDSADREWLLAPYEVYCPELGVRWLPHERAQVRGADAEGAILREVGRYRTWTLLRASERSKWLTSTLETEFFMERATEAKGVVVERWTRRRG